MGGGTMSTVLMDQCKVTLGELYDMNLERAAMDKIKLLDVQLDKLLHEMEEVKIELMSKISAESVADINNNWFPSPYDVYKRIQK